MSDLNAVLSYVDSHLKSALERLIALLRIKSISTDPAFADECSACAGVARRGPAQHRLRGQRAQHAGPPYRRGS